jgi:hypothetical protein
MNRFYKLILTAVFFITSISVVTAEIPTAVIPFKGENSRKKIIEMKVKSIISKKGGISFVDDNTLKKIIKIHEQAMLMGSDKHDISKIKVAEYLIKGRIESGKLGISAVDVNTGTEIYSGLVNIKNVNSYSFKREIGKLIDAILFNAVKKKRSTPDEAIVYMEVIKNFINSLGPNDSNSYPYISFYHKNLYQKPIKKDREIVRKAKIFLKVLRPIFIRSKITFLKMKNDSTWVYITVIVNKRGRKSKHKFGIIELNDGSLAIGLYESL